DVGANLQLRSESAAGRDCFSPPHRRADVLFALRIGRILLIEHDALRERRSALVLRRGCGRRLAVLLLRYAAGEFRLARRRLGRLRWFRPQMGEELIKPTYIGPLPRHHRTEAGNNNQYRRKLGETAIRAWRPRLPIMLCRFD